MLSRRVLLTLGLLSLALPATSLACVAGIAYQKDVGHFRAQMVHDLYRINPGQTVRFHFMLDNLTHRSYVTGGPIDYDVVEAVFRHGNDIVYRHTVERAEEGETAFDYTMPRKNATYTMDIRHIRKGEEIAAYSLPVKVGWGNIWSTIFRFGKRDKDLLEGVIVTRQ